MEVVDMQAAYYDSFGGPENIQVGERPGPAPDAEHMVVRTQAAGVGVWDLGIMAGLFGQVSLPRIPGAEVAGTVEVAADGFRVGDRVFGSLWFPGDAGIPDPRGGFAELAAVRADSAAAMPDGIDFPEAAALVISASTAYEGLIDRAKLQPGETVLVTAASGGVGSAAVQIASSAGARVVAVSGAPDSDYLRDLGAETTVDYHAPDFVEQLRRAAPAGFDVLFDGTGNEVRDQALTLVRKGGRAILIALGAPPPPPADGVEIQSFGATVNSGRLQAVAELVSAGRLQMPVQAEFPLKRAREALEHVGERRGRGRVVLQIGD
jgi:NADPH:quinone reductase